jgi:hypothetical protein
MINRFLDWLSKSRGAELRECEAVTREINRAYSNGIRHGAKITKEKMRHAIKVIEEKYSCEFDVKIRSPKIDEARQETIGLSHFENGNEASWERVFIEDVYIEMCAYSNKDGYMSFRDVDKKIGKEAGFYTARPC